MTGNFKTQVFYSCSVSWELNYNMNIVRMLSVLAALSAVGITFVLSSRLARKSSTSLFITKSNINNNSASQSNNVSLNILLDFAREYYVKGDYKKADIFFERVLEIEPNHIETLNDRGILLYRQSDYDKARNSFEKVLQVDPKNIVALNNIEILDEKKEDGSSQQQKAKPATSTDTSQQQKAKPATSTDSGTIPRADSRNPYNDPTLPYYNPDLDKDKKKEDGSNQQQKAKPATSTDSGTIPRADSRNPYNDPTLPYYNPDLDKKNN